VHLSSRELFWVLAAAYANAKLLALSPKHDNLTDLGQTTLSAVHMVDELAAV